MHACVPCWTLHLNRLHTHFEIAILKKCNRTSQRVNGPLDFKYVRSKLLLRGNVVPKLGVPRFFFRTDTAGNLKCPVFIIWSAALQQSISCLCLIIYCYCFHGFAISLDFDLKSKFSSKTSALEECPDPLSDSHIYIYFYFRLEFIIPLIFARERHSCYTELNMVVWTNFSLM